MLEVEPIVKPNVSAGGFCHRGTEDTEEERQREAKPQDSSGVPQDDERRLKPMLRSGDE